MKYRSVFLFVFFTAVYANNSQAGTLFVAAGGDLQAALNKAQPGDEVVVEAGATFIGPFTLPRKPNADGREIVIRTTTPDNELPVGVRVSPKDAPKMPRLTGTGPWVLNTDQAAANYRLIGLEIAPASGYEMLNVVLLGSLTSDGRWTESSISQLPQNIIFDRMYIHGDPVAGSRRGIALNGRDIKVYDSYVSDFKQTCCDSQAVAGWNGPGPFVIQNNYLEAAGENIMFGGGDPSIPGLVPSDIQIRNNRISKPVRWKPDDASYEGKNWVVKNLFELKNARNVVLDGNVLENNWADDQNGFAIVITPRNQDGAAPWSTVENVEITNNVVARSTSAVNILGWDNNAQSQRATNILIKGNLFFEIGGELWGENLSSTYGYGHGGWFLQVLDGTDRVVVEHNTILESKGVLVADVARPSGTHTGEVHTGFVFRNNIVRDGVLGIAGATTDSGYATLLKYFSAPIIENNVIIGGHPNFYPGYNHFPATVEDVGFVSTSNSDYRLSQMSSFKSQATDGNDMGATGSVFDLAPVSMAGGMTASTNGSGTLQIGSAEISGTMQAPSRIAILGYRQNNVLVSEAGIPASAPMTKGRISVDVSATSNTGLAISNPNDSAATVLFVFTNADGQDFGSGSFQLPAHGQIARFLDQAPFNIVRPSNGTLTFSSRLPVAATALRGFINERSEFLMTSLPVADLNESIPAISYFPHFVDGGGWSTRFILINPSDSAISGELTFFDQNGQSVKTIGYSISARGSRQFSTDGSSAKVQTGSARVVASVSSTPPVGAEVLSFKQAGVTVSEAGFSSGAAGTAFRIYAETGSGDGAQTGVALMNASGAEERIDFQLAYLDGVPAASTGSLVIPPFGQRALFLNQIPGLQSLSAFKGILRISSAGRQNIAVVGLRGRLNERGDFLMTAIPPVNEDTPGSATAVFPHIVDGGGYTTQFITFSGTYTEPASGNLRLFSQAGETLNITLH